MKTYFGYISYYGDSPHSHIINFTETTEFFVKRLVRDISAEALQIFIATGELEYSSEERTEKTVMSIHEEK